MDKFRRIYIILTFVLLSTTCFSQSQDGLGRYTVRINGKELSISLVSDSTYEAETLWGPSYGFYDIIASREDTLFDRIIFGDMVYGTGEVFYPYHVSIPQEVAKSLVDSNLYSKDSFYVAMYDLTGEFVTYYDVCFLDSTGEILFCDYNEKKHKAHSIPLGTSSIGMTGEQHNFATNFHSEYCRSQGSIAYVIGPSPDRFFIKKDRSCILYRPCHCESYDAQCCLVLIKVPHSIKE
jgi:hypothetical protein